MKVFFDCEFLEGTQKSFWGTTKPTIDLISIGMINEDGSMRYYAVCKDFNLKEAWSRYDLDHGSGDQRNLPPRKVYWIRDNVLRPIFEELAHKDYPDSPVTKFNYKSIKYLINKYGQTRKEIAEDILSFVGSDLPEYHLEGNYPEFYAYYGAYDWVCLMWIFGKMIDRPKGFPMYVRDLKQMLDEKLEKLNELPMVIHTYAVMNGIKTSVVYDLETSKTENKIDISKWTLSQKLELIKTFPDYPKEENAHNALSDATWNQELYKFIKGL